jgi:hypothetical protein
MLMKRYRQSAASTFTVYDTRGTGLYDFTAGGKSIVVGGLTASKDPFFLETLTKFRMNNGITALFEFQHLLSSIPVKTFHYNGFYRKGSCIGFQGKRIVILNKPLSRRFTGRMKVDYLVVSGGPGTDLKDVVSHLIPGIVILDSSNPPWKVKAWMKEAHWLGVHCHAVTVSGAFADTF